MLSTCLSQWQQRPHWCCLWRLVLPPLLGKPRVILDWSMPHKMDRCTIFLGFLSHHLSLRAFIRFVSFSSLNILIQIKMMSMNAIQLTIIFLKTLTKLIFTYASFNRSFSGDPFCTARAYGFLLNSSPTICRSQLVSSWYRMSVASPEDKSIKLVSVFLKCLTYKSKSSTIRGWLSNQSQGFIKTSWHHAIVFFIKFFPHLKNYFIKNFRLAIALP